MTHHARTETSTEVRDAAAAEIRRLGWSLRSPGTTVDHLPSVFAASLLSASASKESSRTLCGKVVEQVTMPMALRPCRSCARVHHAAVVRRRDKLDAQRRASRAAPPEITRHAFGRRLLALWNLACASRDVSSMEDFTEWSGESKNLLLDLQVTWDGHEYVLPPPPKRDAGA